MEETHGVLATAKLGELLGWLVEGVARTAARLATAVNAVTLDIAVAAVAAATIAAFFCRLWGMERCGHILTARQMRSRS